MDPGLRAFVVPGLGDEVTVAVRVDAKGTAASARWNASRTG
ncbi:hypothetical protein [Brevibacterium sp. H-BE7]|nr:hypothetical protein [Brevibacterium sp. H-BE7]MDK8433920.1 hypothetical protein [Brevibacterium sp. H-BE7]